MNAAKFLTIKQAAEFTGKSEKTMRRLVAELKADSNKALKKEATSAGRKFKYLISANYLQKRYGLRPDASQDQKSNEAEQHSVGSATEARSDRQLAIEALTNQLKVKDEQIKDLTEANKTLLERVSEGNKLQANLQLQVQQLNTKLLEPEQKEAMKIEKLEQQLEQKDNQLQQLNELKSKIDQLKKQRLMYALMILVGVLLFVAILLIVDKI